MIIFIVLFIGCFWIIDLAETYVGVSIEGKKIEFRTIPPFVHFFGAFLSAFIITIFLYCIQRIIN